MNLQGEIIHCVTSDGVRLDGIWMQNQSDRTWLVTHGVNGNFYHSTLLREVALFLFGKGNNVLLVNNRGHDLCAFSADPVPHRIGSQFENVAHCCRDFEAWGKWCSEVAKKPLYGLAAHSLGAVKAAYWLAQREGTEGTAISSMQRFWAMSPPRLNTALLLDDPKKSVVFRDHLTRAKECIDRGEPETILRVRFPLPNWVSAQTFFDKYGSGEKYDYMSCLEKIAVPTLWSFGDSEVRNGSVNFLNADNQIASEVEYRNLFQHSVIVVDGADHSYRGVREALFQAVDAWLPGNG